MSKHWKGYLLAIICCILFLIPFFSPGYSVGGDDSRLYYLYPKEYLINHLFQVMTNNGLGDSFGYMAVSYAAPLISLVFFVKTLLPMVNTQHIFYGLNMSLGFIFCYLLFRTLDKSKENTHVLIAILASCVYITSPYVVKTLYQPELIVIYLVALAPLFFYTFTRSIEDNNVKWSVACAVGVAILSSSLNSIAWFLPFFIVFIPYFVYCALRYGFSFWKSTAVFIVVGIGLNWYWLIHGLVSVLSSRMDKTLVSTIASKQFVQDSGNTAYSMIFLNGPTHQVAGYLRTSWEDRLPMPSWNLIGSSMLLLVTVAGLQLKRVQTHMRVLFGVALISLNIAFFMITPNMGKWNVDVFLFLNRTVPLFSMFRNMNSKFGPAMAFVSAWMLFLSLIVIIQSKQKILKFASLGLGIVLLIYQLPLFLNAQGIGVPKQNISSLSADYMQLVQYISTFPTTKRFVWYPMTFPGYPPIQDSTDKKTWYLGLSPLQVLAGKSDIAGFYGLQTTIDPDRNWKILELFKQKKYEDIVSILASYNIGYVITINKTLPDTVQKQLDIFSFVTLQTQDYKNVLLGKKLYDFGDTYSLYTINPGFTFDTVFLTDNPLDIHAPKETVSFHRVRTNEYNITLTPTTKVKSLVLLAPYHSLWQVSLPKTEEDTVLVSNHRVAYGYGNAWDIRSKSNLSGPITLTIEFIPDRFTVPSIILSGIIFIGSCLYIIIPKKRK